MNALETKVLRLVVAAIWLVTAVLSYGVYPMADSMLLVQGLGLPPAGLRYVVHAGATVDAVLGLLTLLRPNRGLWFVQIVVILAYTVLATLLVPEYWLHPFGPLLKNLAIFALLWLLWRHDGPEARMTRIQ